MKILFISSAPLEYSSSSNMRNIALLKGLIENKNQVYTLTPEPQKESALYDENFCKLNFEKKYFIPLGTIHSAVTMKKNHKSRIKDKVYEIVKKFKIYDFRSTLAKKEIHIGESFDYIISSSDPKSSHLIAETLIKRNPNITKKWIQYWGDPFATDINKKSFVPNFIVKKEEERLISLADKVIYVSPFTLKQQQKLYQRYKEKMEFLPIPYQEKIIYKETNNERLRLGYFGEYHSRNRNILPLYEVIKKQKDKDLVICGNSDLNLCETENIKIYQRQPIQKVRKMEEESDILVCVCNSNGTQIPGKIYHYSATNKPILVIVDGEYSKEIEKYLKEYNRFYLCQNNMKSISEIIYKIKNSNKKYEPTKKLEAKNIAKRFI